MKTKLRVLMVVFFILYLTGCALSNEYRRPEMRAKDREDFMLASGGYLRNNVRIAFIDGRIVTGTPLHLIEALYGEPDLVIQCPYQSIECNRILVYGKSASKSFGSVSIKNDTAVKVHGQLAVKQRF